MHKSGWMAGVAALALASPGLGAGTSDPPPPSAPTGEVYAGECVSPALSAPEAPGREAGIFAGVLGALVPGLIDKGFDWLGAKLASLGEDKRTVVFGSRASEEPFNDQYCIQLVRMKSSGRTLASLTAEMQGWPTTQRRREKLHVPLDKPVDFFVEFWVRPSAEGSAVSLTPTLLYYPTILAKEKNGVKDVAFTVTTQLVPASGNGTNGTWAFPKQAPSPSLRELLPVAKRDGDGNIYRQTPAALIRLCERGCEGASPWYANPWAAAKLAPQPPVHTPAQGGAAKGRKPAGRQVAAGVTQPAANAAARVTYTSVPVNLGLQWTEIRAGSKFFKTVSELFTTVRPKLEANVQQLLLNDVAVTARTTEMTAVATALTTFSTKLTEAETARVDNYCAAQTKPGANWSALSAQLRAKQLAANAAALAAEQPLPFKNLAQIQGEFDPSICPA